MKKIFTLLFLLGASLTTGLLQAQDIDRSFVFVDENGNELENGATVMRNQVEEFDEGVYMISSGLWVKKTDDATSDYLRVRYNITTIDNGSYQLCFPMNCTKQTSTGEYLTPAGGLTFNPQNLQSEWLLEDEGSCTVELKIEVMDKASGFPPTYNYVADGPSLTLKFVYSTQPDVVPGDVNGDGNINISDINTIIDCILTSRTDIEAADVNGDGAINISDINAVIALIMKS